MAVSGVGLSLATGGGVLLWSGLAGVTPLDLVKGLASGGQAPQIKVGSPVAVIAKLIVGSLGQLASGGAVPGGGGGLPQVPGWLQWLPGADQVSLPGPAGQGERVAAAARSHLGTPYRWGGATPAGWDCSGMVTYVLHHDIGLDLPDNQHTITTAFLTWSGATTIPTDQMQPGDLICWITHIAICTGPGQGIGAENPSVGTVERPISQLGPGGGETYVIRRVIASTGASAQVV